jgi:hemoglobin
MTTLSDRLGGQGAIDAFVPLLYEKVRADDRINQFFDGVDMGVQGGKMNAFLTMAFGGPNNYSGKDIRDGHSHLVRAGVNDSHFDAVLEHINATLEKLNVPADVLSQVMGAAGSRRYEVLSK